MEFMKEKLAMEDDEMKKRVEEYRLASPEKSPSPVGTDQARNLELQS
jgi:hypothetical protein